MRRTIATLLSAVAIAVGGAYYLDRSLPLKEARRALDGVSQNRGRLGEHESALERHEAAIATHGNRLDTQAENLRNVEGKVGDQGNLLGQQAGDLAEQGEVIKDLSQEVKVLRAAQERELERARAADEERVEILERLERLERAFAEANKP
ncbi:hypothetical protein ACFL59_02015 [Planctomycetota bacterium]